MQNIFEELECKDTHLHHGLDPPVHLSQNKIASKKTKKLERRVLMRQFFFSLGEEPRLIDVNISFFFSSGTN